MAGIVGAGEAVSFPTTPEQRAVIFIDGNNWYYALGRSGVRSSGPDYRRLARKLVRARQLRRVRYDMGRVWEPLSRVRGQQKFLKGLRQQEVDIFLGNSRRSPEGVREREAKAALLRTFETQASEVPGNLLRVLREYCASDSDSRLFVEKQVDTMIAVDLVEPAYRDEYDVAYLLSADSDFVPPVEAVCRPGKRVFVVGPRPPYESGQVATRYLPVSPAWFEDLYL